MGQECGALMSWELVTERVFNVAGLVAKECATCCRASATVSPKEENIMIIPLLPNGICKKI